MKSTNLLILIILLLSYESCRINCSDIVVTTYAIEKTITGYTQKKYEALGSVELGNNYFQIDVKKQTEAENDAIPGTVYIIDMAQNKFLGIDVYISTTCNSECTVNERKPSSDLNCNSKVLKKADNAYFAYSTNIHEDCSIYINLIANIQKDANSYKVVQIPNLRMLSTVTEAQTKYPLEIFWSIDETTIPRYITLTYSFKNRNNFDSIENFVNLVDVDKNDIKSFAVGIDSTSSNCNYNYPSSSQTCKTTYDEQTKNYVFTSDGQAKTIYLAIVLTSNQKIYIKSQFEVNCASKYVYDYANNKCIVSCTDKQFFDNDSYGCKNCITNCIDCSNAQYCDRCIDGYELSEDATKCVSFSMKLVIPYLFIMLIFIF